MQFFSIREFFAQLLYWCKVMMNTTISTGPLHRTCSYKGALKKWAVILCLLFCR